MAWKTTNSLDSIWLRGMRKPHQRGVWPDPPRPFSGLIGRSLCCLARPTHAFQTPAAPPSDGILGSACCTAAPQASQTDCNKLVVQRNTTADEHGSVVRLPEVLSGQYLGWHTNMPIQDQALLIGTCFTSARWHHRSALVWNNQ